MSTARERMLGRIATALHEGRLVAESHAPHRVPLAARADRVPPAGSPAERFAAALTVVGGTVHRADSREAAAAAVAAVCRANRAHTVLAWEEPEIGLAGLAAGLAGEGIGWDTGQLPVDQPARRARLDELEPIRVGVTGALGGIAATGTIALASGPGRPRLASLLPPVHIAVLREELIHETLPDLLAAQPEVIQLGSNLVLITGPSRTGDIEMTLTRGVHGPGEVHVVLVTSR